MKKVEFMTPKEYAKHTGYSQSHVYWLINNGKVKMLKNSTTKLIMVEE